MMRHEENPQAAAGRRSRLTLNRVFGHPVKFLYSHIFGPKLLIYIMYIAFFES